MMAILAPSSPQPWRQSRWGLCRKTRCFPGSAECHLVQHGQHLYRCRCRGRWLVVDAACDLLLVPVFAAASTAAVMSIPGARIDRKRARAGEFASGKPLGILRLVTTNRSLLTLGLIVASFHFASDAMLTLAGQKLALQYPGLKTALTSSLILTVQLITIPVAAAVGRKAKSWGVKPFLAIACIALIARGMIFGAVSNAAIVIAAQVLDGIAIGIWDTLLPLMLATLWPAPAATAQAGACSG